MKPTRRSVRGSTSTTENHTAPPNEILQSTLIARTHLAEFIKRSSDAISSPWFFLIRGNCMKGLLRHMGLTPTTYSALLLAANLVNTKGSQVQFLATECKSFLERYSLFGDRAGERIPGILN